MKRYGHLGQRKERYPLAAWVWGHRLRVGQHWMEYLLEFLNVLAGYKYELGQGITEGVDELPHTVEYRRFTRLGLRRFVFYDEREKSANAFDDRALQMLVETLVSSGVINSGSARVNRDPLTLAGALLRSLSAVEEQRSWFAKSLFPVHQNMLYWEALRPKSSKANAPESAEDTSPEILDSDIAFDSRNYFARGGELYYLILAAGTRNDPVRRRSLAESLQELLTTRNKDLGLLAGTIDETWHNLIDGHAESDTVNGREAKGSLGWILDPECSLYVSIAEDVDTFLRAELDPLETLDLLAHLIGFHLTLYLYHRAHPNASAEHHREGTCSEMCRPALLIDAAESSNGGVIRDVSVALFREQEALIVRKGREYVHQYLREKAEDLSADSSTEEHLAHNVAAEVWQHFGLKGLRAATLRPFKQRENALLERLGRGEETLETFMVRYEDALTELLMGDFRKNFLGVHRKLAKAVGFVLPRKGPRARFVLGENLLKALTLANASNERMTYDEFLVRLYKRYGLIVGIDEARYSGLFDRQRINAEYYDRNRSALLEKMEYAGLAVQYSDATAMIAPAESSIRRSIDGSV